MECYAQLCVIVTYLFPFFSLGVAEPDGGRSAEEAEKSEEAKEPEESEAEESEMWEDSDDRTIENSMFYGD